MIKPIFQESATDCGIACIAIIAGYHGHNISIRQLEAQFRVGCTPLSAHDIVQLSGKLNMHSRVVRLEPEEISELQVPCILHWKMNHFVVLESIAKNKWNIVDPAVGRRTISRLEADRLFTGVALELSPSERFIARKPSSPISLMSLAKGLSGDAPKLIYIMLIAIGLEAITLLVPLISQMVIDGAITSQDKDFLLVSAIGGVFLVISQFTLRVAGDIARLKLSQNIGLRWSSNLFLHLIKLPWAYFQHRQLGEISSRFAAIKPIKEFLLLTLTSTLIDLTVLVGACAIMAMYSTALLWVVVSACASYATVQLAFYPFLKEATSERLILSAREHTYFLESIRSALTLKMTGNLAHRSSRWNNLVVDVQNRDTATQRIQIMASGANTLIFGIESMLVLYIGGHLIIEASMSIGMLVAFMGFKSHFTSRLSRVVDTLIQWRMQSVHCDRLADIALHQTEDSQTSNRALIRQPLKIELINVSFRNNEQSPWIVKDVNLTILPGDSLAIIGRSGSGKSTLAKLILGLLEPCEGQILINGIAIGEIGVTELRAVTGTILQEDQVLSGTIAENIAGFDLEACMSQAQCVAKLANLHHIINKLPMGYQTVISNTCSTLSSGQRQRLFLARALYKSPNLLVLDEATNNLDMHSEQHVISSLKDLPLTLITIAHRRESLTLASRFVQMEKGRIVMENEITTKIP